MKGKCIGKMGDGRRAIPDPLGGRSEDPDGRLCESKTARICALLVLGRVSLRLGRGGGGDSDPVIFTCDCPSSSSLSCRLLRPRPSVHAPPSPPALLVLRHRPLQPPPRTLLLARDAPLPRRRGQAPAPAATSRSPRRPAAASRFTPGALPQLPLCPPPATGAFLSQPRRDVPAAPTCTTPSLRQPPSASAKCASQSPAKRDCEPPAGL